MKTETSTVDQYIKQLPEDRKPVMSKLRQLILKNLPRGFEETISYGMIGYVVPKSLYSAGYHCNTELPLPFINLASQKTYIALYHMGLYTNEKLMEWFSSEYPKHSQTKLDMGKSCIRFKKMDQIPFELIGEVVSKMSVEEWVNIYEANIRK